MRDNAGRFAPWIACAVLAWVAWPAFEGEQKAAGEEQPKAPILDQRKLVVRTETEPVTVTRDPFFSEWAPYGRDWAPEHLAALRQAEQEREQAVARAAAEAQAAERKRRALAEAARRARGPATFTLRLDAVTILPDGPVVRVCGRTLRVGDAIPELGLDPPAVLARADAESADVTWHGTVWTVRIDDGPLTVTMPREADDTADGASGGKP